MKGEKYLKCLTSQNSSMYFLCYSILCLCIKSTKVINIFYSIDKNPKTLVTLLMRRSASLSLKKEFQVVNSLSWVHQTGQRISFASTVLTTVSILRVQLTPSLHLKYVLFAPDFVENYSSQPFFIILLCTSRHLSKIHQRTFQQCLLLNCWPFLLI